MASITVNSDGYWGDDTILASGSWSGLVRGDTVTISGGAVLTIDASQQTPTGYQVGVNIVCTASLGQFVQINTSTTVAQALRGYDLGTIQVESGCKWKISGGYAVLQASGGGDWTGDGTANQTIPTGSGYGWTGLGYAAIEEPNVIFVETGSGTDVWEAWTNIADNNLSQIGGKSGGVSSLGRWFSYNASTGVISFGDGGSTTDGQGGNVVPNGARVRVYNIGVGSQDGSGPSVSGTLGNNWTIDSRNAGLLEFDKCYFFGFYMDARYSGSVNWDGVGVLLRGTNLQLSKNVTIDRLYTGLDRYTADNAQVINLESIIGLSLANSIISHNQSTGPDLESCAGATISNCDWWMLDRQNTYAFGALYLLQCSGTTISDCRFIGAQLRIRECSNTSVTDCEHSDSPNGNVFGSQYTRCLYGEDSYGVHIDGWSVVDDGAVAGTNGAACVERVTTIKNLDYDASNFSSGWSVNANEDCSIVKSNFNTLVGTAYPPVNTAPGGNSVVVQNLELSTIGQARVPSYQSANDNMIVKHMDVNENRIYSIQSLTVGTHFFEVRTDLTNEYGWMGLWFAEKVSGGNAYSTSGSGIIFNGEGHLYITDGTSSITYEWPHVIKGITGFRAVSHVLGGSGTGNFDIEYDIDTGNGYSGSWTTLNSTNLSAETISGGTIQGFKVRISHSGSGSNSDYLDIIRWATTNDYGTHKYPEALVDITIKNVQDGSEYWVKNADTDEVIATGTQSGTADIIVSSVGYSGTDETLVIRVRKGTSGTKYKPYETQATLTESGASVYVSQVEDTIA
jgi:hypothetical protein